MNEATLNLAVARHVAANLRELGVEVLLTRSDDSYISLDDRVAVASSGRADIFVSIHANAFQDGSVEGIEVYHKSEPDASPLVNASRDLAARILEAMLSATGARSRGVKRDERGLRVLRKGEVPAVLIEMGYLTNADERSRLQDAAYQEQLAQGIVAGIREYLSQTPAALN
jgi:N-acetylmuramoyl-L-alanine amidase